MQMAKIVGFVLKNSQYLKKTATSQFLLINSNVFLVYLKILGGIMWQVTSLQGGMLVKKGQATAVHWQCTGSAVKLWEESDYGLNESINYEAVCRAAPGFARVC